MPIFIRTLLFTLIGPVLVGGFVPKWLAESKLDGLMFGKSPPSTLTSIIGYTLVIVGSAIYLWCAYDFTFVGRGTPAVFDPPRNLVIRGLYRYIRNPMYVGVILLLLGQVFLYGSPALFFYTIILSFVFSVFVLLYEEPTLRRKFGIDYIDYCQRVNRWLP